MVLRERCFDPVFAFLQGSGRRIDIQCPGSAQNIFAADHGQNPEGLNSNHVLEREERVCNEKTARNLLCLASQARVGCGAEADMRRMGFAYAGLVTALPNVERAAEQRNRRVCIMLQTGRTVQNPSVCAEVSEALTSAFERRTGPMMTTIIFGRVCRTGSVGGEF